MRTIVKTFVGLWLVFFVGSHLHAQSLFQTIRGTVIDEDTQLPLAGATIAIPVLQKGGYSDEEGNFRIEHIPVGRHDMVIQYMGYESRTIPNIVLTSSKEVVLRIGLIESVIQMDAVVIEAKEEKNVAVNELSLVSTRTFSVEETKRFAGGLDDPSRMAVSFAGVQTGTFDDGNEIIIRGNSPKGLLWRLEGIEIPSPNHFTDEGASSGAVSIISSQMLANSDFSTGAFTAEYGNALSGVFDINLRKGNNEKREYAFQVGLLGADFSAEGPFKKGKPGSYLFNYRYSTIAMLNQLGLDIVGDAVPVFQDLSFKLNLPTKKYGTFSLFGIGGLSGIEEQGYRTLADGTEEIRWKDEFQSNMGIAGLNHRLILSDKTWLKSSLSLAGQQVLYKFNPKDDDGNFFLEEDQNTINYAAKAQVELTSKLNNRHLIKSGLIYTQNFYDLTYKEYFTDRQEWVTDLDEEGDAGVWQGFSNWRYRISDQLTLNTGLHAMYFQLNDNYSIEPRLGLKWQFSPKQYISAGFGVHSRREGLAFYLARSMDDEGQYSQPNQNLDYTKARHYVLSYDHMFTNNLHFRLEAYYQDLYDVPVLKDPTSFGSSINFEGAYTNVPLTNNGTANNYGLELTFEKFFSNNWYFLLTSSLYESKYTGADGVERNTRFNSNYVSNFLIGKEFPIGKARNNRFVISTRTIWAGGRRFTPIDLEASRAAGYTIRQWDRYFAERTADYIRLDAQLSYVMNKSNVTHIIRLDIQNALNRSNEIDQYYVPSLDIIEKELTGSIIPVLSYKLQF